MKGTYHLAQHWGVYVLDIPFTEDGYGRQMGAAIGKGHKAYRLTLLRDSIIY